MIKVEKTEVDAGKNDEFFPSYSYLPKKNIGASTRISFKFEDAVDKRPWYKRLFGRKQPESIENGIECAIEGEDFPGFVGTVGHLMLSSQIERYEQDQKKLKGEKIETKHQKKRGRFSPNPELDPQLEGSSVDYIASMVGEKKFKELAKSGGKKKS